MSQSTDSFKSEYSTSTPFFYSV